MNTVRALSVLLVVALLGACATLPPPEQGNKTLLAIVVKTVKAGGYALSYEFGVKESAEKLKVNPMNGIVVFDRLAPGSYTIDKVAVVPGPTIAGGTYLGSIEPRSMSPVAFKLAEGQITILQWTIVVDEEVTGPQRTSQRYSWVATNRDEALAELAKYDNFDRWRVAP